MADDDYAYTASELTLDESKLVADHSEVWLLRYLSKAEKILKHLTAEEIKPAQAQFETALLKITTSPPPSPKPGRPIRHLIARCLILLHQKSESRSLFDVVREMLRVASEPKGPQEKENRVACWYVVGEIMKALGSNNMSFMADICVFSLKCLKTSSNPVLLRYHSILALQKSFATAGKAVSDQAGKDVVKQLRNGLSDKALSIQRVCADTLLAISQYTSFLVGQSDIENIVSSSIKSLDSADHQTRVSLSQLAATLLASTQVEGSAPVAEPKKKASKNADDDDEGALPTPVTDGQSRTLFTLQDMFNQLANPFNQKNASRKTRNALVQVYASLLTTLGVNYVELHYSKIVQHLMTDIISNPRNTASRYEILSVRKLVGILLRDLIGVRLLSEQGQVTAIKELANLYLKKWPSLMPNHVPPSKHVLVPVLNEVARLLEQLGSAPLPVQEALTGPLISLLSHPSHSVRVATAWCLRCFCHTAPIRLSKTIATIMSDLNRDVAHLSTPTPPADLHRRMIGRAFAMSALIAVIPERPLYVSYDLSANILDLAIQLLKKSGEHEIPIATAEVQVAWTLIGALMTLGPSFVKIHLPQILVLWRNALPKPTSKDSANAIRSETEWGFLLHVRETALGSILAFLRYNVDQLVTLDVARRLVALLGNTLTFVNNFSIQHAQSLKEQTPSTSSTLLIVDRETMLRRRVFQCFTALGPTPATETLQGTLLQSAVAAFAEPDSFIGSATQAAIQAATGNFTTIWSVADGHGWGISTLQTADEYPGEIDDQGRRNLLNRDSVEVQIEALLSCPVIGSLEYDTLELCKTHSGSVVEQSIPLPSPPATGVIDAAIELFAVVFPTQDADVQAQTLKQVLGYVRSPKFEKNPGRKMAVLVNSVTACRVTLQGVAKTHSRRSREVFSPATVNGPMREILQDAILGADLSLRTSGSDAMGRLTSLSGTAFMNAQIQWLVDQVVNNRNPESRAGCALCFGSIFSNVGSLSGGPVLKTVVNILISLSSDPHPVVHFWSMIALSQVISSASLEYSPFISSTLGQLANIYVADTHEPEGGSLGSVNLRGDLPAYQVICRIMNALIGVLGPELQDSGAVRSLLFILVNELTLEADEGICVEAIKCLQQFLMFAPDQVSIPTLVEGFRIHLASTRRPLKIVSINALYQLVRMDAPMMSKLGGNQLVEDLFGMLDDDPSIEGVRDVISNWVKQTSAASPSGWIDLCQRIMNRTTAAQQSVTTATVSKFQDEESESIVISATVAKATGGRLTSRWRTQLFALQCLHDVMAAVAAAGLPEQFDPILAAKMKLNPRSVLVSRVSDLIKMAFSASAAQVTEIRLQGLVVLKDVILHFASSPDPDFSDSLLLEQHQAPIAAALTPAFASDSTPEVLDAAVQICATFVGSGVVKEIERMGRILKLLTSALEQCKDAEMVSLGEVTELSSNASVMLKVSILTAWSELQVASLQQSYLHNVVGPHKDLLLPFWITCLRDYARMKADPESGMGMSSSSSSVDLMASGLGREVLLPYYSRAWVRILHALTCCMAEGDTRILKAMDGREGETSSTISSELRFRKEPSIYFFVMYGMAFEALATAGDEVVPPGEGTISPSVVSLEALKYFVQQQYAGESLLDETLFNELCSLFYRLAQTSSLTAQSVLVSVVASFSQSYAKELSKPSEVVGISKSDSSRLSRCLAIVTYVLSRAVSPPGAGAAVKSAVEGGLDRITLIKSAFSAYTSIVECYDIKQREDLMAVAMHLYADLLKDETSSQDIVGPTLPLAKTLCDQAYSYRQPTGQVFLRVLNGFLSACLQNIDEMRGRSGIVTTNKVKNNLLALVLSITTLPADIKVSKAIVDRLCFTIGRELSDDSEISGTAVQCARTLILSSTGEKPLLQYCISQLLPPLVRYIAKCAADADTLVKDDTRLKAVEDVMKTFIGLASSLPGDEHKLRAVTILLPTLILLLDPSEPTVVHTLTVQSILSLATVSPSAFRDAKAALAPAENTKLETSIRQTVENQQLKASVVPLKVASSKIELKMFG